MPLYLGKEMISGVSLGLPGKSAYEAALETNPELGLTEEEFGQQMANLGTAASQSYVRKVVDSLTAADVGARADNWMPTASDVGADPSGTAVNAVSEHNVNSAAHNDIRIAVNNAANAAKAAQTAANNAQATADGKAEARHNQAASTITTGTFSTTAIKAKTGTDYTTARVRNIQASTTDLTAGTSSLASGDLYFVYE